MAIEFGVSTMGHQGNNFDRPSCALLLNTAYKSFSEIQEKLAVAKILDLIK